MGHWTYNIYSFIPRDTDLGALSTEINTDNAHCQDVRLYGNRLIGQPESCADGLGN